jgi:Flp pilus assembly protein TadB
MPAVHTPFRSQNHRGGRRQEPKALVVAFSVLQLAMIVVVWLLALVPMALMALGAMVIQTLKPVAVKAPTAVDF